MYRKTNHAIQNNSKLSIYWYMMLFSHWLFWFKNWRFSTNSCKEFIIQGRRKLFLYGGGGRREGAEKKLKKTMAETSQSSPPENQFRTKVLMIQNLLFGFFIFFENIISGIQLFYIRSNVHVVIRFFFISDFLAESLNANKTSKKNHSFYNTVSL